MPAIGFTGTQAGMTSKQMQEVEARLWSYYDIETKDNWFHHGDCIGADAQAHSIAKNIGYLIVLHPPTDPRKRAFCKADIEMAPKPYLDRNRKIVDGCSFLIAAPKELEEELRSGTWATVRYARKVNRDLVIVHP